MILNVGCGGRSADKACYFGDVRVDVKRFPAVTILMDAHFLAFKDSVFDRIVCFEVLEHLDSPFSALKEFKRVLKHNGDVIISVPNVWYWRRVLRFLLKKHKVFDEFPDADHKQAWDVFEFCSLAYQAGFKVTDVKFVNWYPKGKRKLGILEPLLRFIPQISFYHVMFRLKTR
ncbi:MAG: methyltransferase domain-containing protein [Candidatus Bathyarchaeota archaeon]|nr:methyltransferase domain-containing protein [Candidatus Bathyarchaeota archaeon]